MAPIWVGFRSVLARFTSSMSTRTRARVVASMWVRLVLVKWSRFKLAREQMLIKVWENLPEMLHWRSCTRRILGISQELRSSSCLEICQYYQQNSKISSSWWLTFNSWSPRTAFLMLSSCCRVVRFTRVMVRLFSFELLWKLSNFLCEKQIVAKMCNYSIFVAKIYKYAINDSIQGSAAIHDSASLVRNPNHCYLA